MTWMDKVVVVTGGGSGIGETVCRRFASGGAKVAVVGRTLSKCENTADEIKASGGEAFALQADVAAEEDVKLAIRSVIGRYGKIDVLVNNAAVCPQIKLADMSFGQWNEVINCNLGSIFLMCREVIPHMLEAGGGAIVNLSSVHALATSEGYAAYAATKGGIVSMTRAVALDYAKNNIRVNAVLPGAVHTPMLESSVKRLDDDKEESIMDIWNEAQPIGRVGKTDEIASVVLFAASPDNSFMTGAVLVADGGMTIDL
ncbi:SDR family NAD(P)-dependent oxidoreductase [Paenibacillus sp. MBLB4367]|uniref:SDR family NAD(P)-dependent oxidoreductase n=1 Tax=Paenibacillus sp. MBLB4367 TaxID=3384767 RepID=UPI0039082684